MIHQIWIQFTRQHRTRTSDLPSYSKIVNTVIYFIKIENWSLAWKKVIFEVLLLWLLLLENRLYRLITLLWFNFRYFAKSILFELIWFITVIIFVWLFLFFRLLGSIFRFTYWIIAFTYFIFNGISFELRIPLVILKLVLSLS